MQEDELKRSGPEISIDHGTVPSFDLYFLFSFSSSSSFSIEILLTFSNGFRKNMMSSNPWAMLLCRFSTSPFDHSL
jgi:hypothetical protein